MTSKIQNSKDTDKKQKKEKLLTYENKLNVIITITS